MRRSARRKKTLALTVDRDGIQVAVPGSATDEEVRAFVAKHSTWIRERQQELASAPGPLRFVSGEALPYLGSDLTLVVEQAAAAAARAWCDERLIRVTVPSGLSEDERRALTRTALLAWYRERATERLPEAVDRWWAQLGDGPAPYVLIRDQRKRWGSCGSDGVLRLNWRLVMLDRSLIDYVVVHELSHLRVRDHSPAFWELVARSIPDLDGCRRRLRDFGMRLPM